MHHTHWTPFWHIDFLINELGISSDVIFDILSLLNLKQKLFTFNERSIDTAIPETYFSLAYFIVRYAKREIVSGKRVRMLQVQEMLRDSIKDDLLFPKGYAEKVAEIAKLAESTMREDENNRIIPQQ